MKKVVFTGMTSEQKLDTIKAFFDNNEIKKGAYVKVAYKSERKALKGYEKENGATMVEKYSEGVARLGIDYRHTSDYLTKVVAADGKDTPSRTSEYDTPLSGYENLLIKNEKEGEVRYKVKLFNSKAGGITLYQFDPGERFVYYYAHLQDYAPGIVEGKVLRKGELIGHVGSTGNANPEGPHLHFAIGELGADKKWWDYKAINPYPLLGGR